MTAKDKDYIQRQLTIIQNKADDESLGKYAMSLSVASLNVEVKGFLTRAVDMRQKELHPINPMVVGCDLDDFNGE